MADDWKGEHLIRDVKPDPHAGAGLNMRNQARREYCREPGCNAPLNPDNRTGYCRKHFQKRRRNLK